MILRAMTCWLVTLTASTALLSAAASLRRREKIGRRLVELRPAGAPARAGRLTRIPSSFRLASATRKARTAWAMVPAFLLSALSGTWWSLCVTLPLSLLAVRLLERRKEARRKELIRAQLYDFLDAMIQSMEGGFSILQALGFSAEDVAPPLGLELRRAVADIQYGRELEGSLEELRQRVGEPELDTIVDMLLLLRQKGGNLPLLLRKLRGIMRDRAEIARDIRVYTTQGRWSGYVVAALPVAFLCIESVFSPSIIRPLVSTPLGVTLLAAGLGLDAAGFLCLRRISRLGVSRP